MAHTTETFNVDLKAENWWTDKRTSAKGKWGLQVTLSDLLYTKKKKIKFTLPLSWFWS